jgi:pimeloyl-ACP methyl ester carboxylesterase
MSSATPHPRVVMAGAVPMSGLVAEVPDPRAVIVAIHGGGTSAAYFDCPGHPRFSLLRSAASSGFTAIALDRPGYGASALYQDELMAPERRVELAFGAVDKIARRVAAARECSCWRTRLAANSPCEWRSTAEAPTCLASSSPVPG